MWNWIIQRKGEIVVGIILGLCGYFYGAHLKIVEEKSAISLQHQLNVFKEELSKVDDKIDTTIDKKLKDVEQVKTSTVEHLLGAFQEVEAAKIKANEAQVSAETAKSEIEDAKKEAILASKNAENAKKEALAAKQSNEAIRKIVNEISGEVTIDKLSSALEPLVMQKLSLKNSVIAFYCDKCPPGWEEFKPAYGRFIRGIDRSDEKIDPEGERTPGSIQKDDLKKHSHTRPNAVYDGGPPEKIAKSKYYGLQWKNPPPTGETGGDETRPKNVSLLYCIKKN